MLKMLRRVDATSAVRSRRSKALYWILQSVWSSSSRQQDPLWSAEQVFSHRADVILPADGQPSCPPAEEAQKGSKSVYGDRISFETSSFPPRMVTWCVLVEVAIQSACTLSGR